MLLLDLTLGSPAENLACDEALLDLCETAEGLEVIRFWISQSYFVVLGYGNRLETEANRAECDRLGIPILRRCSGGGAVLQGPGCLNYSVILRAGSEGALSSVTETNCHIMRRHQKALQPFGPVEVEGISDLAIAGRKFSGNAQRRKRSCLLFHGSFLLAFDLQKIAQTLAMPSKAPDYRDGRNHLDFLTNFPASIEAVRSALSKCWQAAEPLPEVPSAAIQKLVTEKYARAEWNEKF